MWITLNLPSTKLYPVQTELTPSQYHIIYVMPQLSMFMYLVLSRDRANLAMARFKLKVIAGTMTL
ncbi:putative secreted protein [Deinococcus grandis]|uniref:Putative secreted protein n=1 Tax=Deinococcus grandis TaxID=57498 RepID=A0A100HMJ8_9DEIO|nr:hypothetical protein DEGR_32790 [Deinococcus grandis]GAQ23481.1 putative secreted protein [Deinococcus grandis]